jgi:hypothetical protein
MGTKRGLLEAIRELHAAAPAPVDRRDAEKGAPFGTRPTSRRKPARSASPASPPAPQLRSDNPGPADAAFTGDLCVQCGLCAADLPGRGDRPGAAARFRRLAGEPKRVVKQEEPFHCTSCAKPFGTRSTIERIAAKLEGHWMFSGANAARREALFMCEDCRVERVVNESFDPYGAPGTPPRPLVRTADDYLPTPKPGKDGLN